MNGTRFARLFVVSAVVFGSMVGAQVRASQVTVDFDLAALTFLSTADYQEDGFLMQRLSGHYDIVAPGLNAFTTPYLSLDIRPQVGETVSAVRFTFIGGRFDLRSLDVSNATSPGFGGQVIASSAGGQRSLDSAGTETFSGLLWSDLDWVVLSGSVPILGPGFDNFVFQPVVPVPAAALLAVSGLAVMCCVAGRRRRPTLEDGFER
jgi:hypothetical protein